MNKKKESKRVRFSRVSYFVLAAIFALCIVLQVFLAGLSVFVSPVNWMNHQAFAHAFGMNLPLFMLLVAFIGKMPRWAYLHTVGLLVFIFLMYLTANMTAVIPWVAALHPIFAMVLFIQPGVILQKSWKLIVKNKEKFEG